jgi:SAM-dependent methyltransferase
MMEGDEAARAWDRASAEYLVRRVASEGDVSYGNLAPLESELHLLGDIRARRILDLGCGGGQNAVACAQRGASVTGVDVSGVQLASARMLAESTGVEVTWVQQDVARYRGVDFDLILALQLLPYVADLHAVLMQCRAGLARHGRLVASFDHPLRTCFLDPEEDELMPYPVRSYATPTTLRWELAGAAMRTRHLPLGGWLDALREAGLGLVRLLELAAPTEICDALWPEDSPLAPLRRIPQSVIVVATPLA